MSKATPHIACVMPTFQRAELALRSIGYFKRQKYPAKTLVIVDDGDDDLADRIPRDDPEIRYIRCDRRLKIGVKRNIGVEASEGPLVAHWDDDDCYGPHRLSTEVDALLAQGAHAVAFELSWIFELPNWKLWRCERSALHRYRFPWRNGAHPSTLVFWKEAWALVRGYPPSSMGEDLVLARRIERGGGKVSVIENDLDFVYLRHARNTWRNAGRSQLRNPTYWTSSDPEKVLSKDDIKFYRKIAKR